MMRFLLIAATIYEGAASWINATPNAAAGAPSVKGWNMLQDNRLDEARMQQLGMGSSPRHDGTSAMDTDTNENANRGHQRELLRVVTANVHALAPRIEEVADWDSDIIIMQETKLAAHAIKDVSGVARDKGWKLIHGKPCRVAHRAGGKNKSCL